MRNDDRGKQADRLVADTQSPLNEAQQTPAGSGDPRTDNSAANVPLPYGIPTDNLHPITQPQGDQTQTNAEVGAPSMPNQEMTKMQNQKTEREYQGDTGRSRPASEESPGRMQDKTSVRPDIERGYGSQHRGDEFNDTDVDNREPREKDDEAA
jgi:hypothetical protein